MIASSVLASSDEDTVSPFAGILRAIVAVFLIPATQVIVSYSIDVGNSMTDAVQKYIAYETVSGWADQETSSLDISPDFQGQRAAEQQSTASAMQDSIISSIDLLLNYGLAVLLDFQLVMICYLFLMGPVSASFFAWPSGVNTLFKPVFANWIDAVTNLVLWRFWWCTILLCMCTRIQWLTESGGYDAGSPWERLVYCAFLAMLSYVPFLPFEFKPGDMLESYLSSVNSGASPSAGGGGGGGRSSGGGSGAKSGGGQSAPPQQTPPMGSGMGAGAAAAAAVAVPVPSTPVPADRSRMY